MINTNKKIVRKYLIILIFLNFFLYTRCNAQNSKRPELLISAGYYDALSAGIQYKLNPNISTGFSAGTNFGLYNKQEYYNSDFFLNWDIKRKNDTTFSSNWFLAANVFNVYIEDAFYKWDFLALVPGIGRVIRCGVKSGFKIEAGPAFNIVLFNKRKTYRNVGWPYHVLADIKLVYYFCL
jgi:hypothetical protein